MNERLSVEVVFATADRQELLEVDLAPGATVADAIRESGIAKRFRDVDLDELPTGIWGRLVSRSQPVEQGDRVEIYRPLDIDPRDARRRLAQEGSTMSADQR